jgi:hypothetical protein
MLLTGFSETLVRLFPPSSDESSEKRLDGGLDPSSTRLVTLSLWLRELRDKCRSDGNSDVEYLGLSCEGGFSKEVEA